MLGLRAGDAKIIRNAGARVTEDALRSLVLAVNLLAVTRVCVVQHTNCAMVGSTEDEIRARIEAARGVDASDWDFLATTDQEATMRHDLALITSCPLLPPIWTSAASSSTSTAGPSSPSPDAREGQAPTVSVDLPDRGLLLFWPPVGGGLAGTRPSGQDQGR